MIKNIIKESVIVILILVVILLILGIVFYEYIPINKIIPPKVEAHQISDELKAELGKQVEQNSEQIITKTYTVESEDLKFYEQNDEYDKGKKNPFSTIQTEEEPSQVIGGQGEGQTQGQTQNPVIDKQPNINTTK